LYGTGIIPTGQARMDVYNDVENGMVCVQNNEWDWYGSGVEWRNSIDLN
jgi:hypothetical protein